VWVGRGTGHVPLGRTRQAFALRGLVKRFNSARKRPVGGDAIRPNAAGGSRNYVLREDSSGRGSAASGGDLRNPLSIA
jgi:hypothetical protein